MNENLQKRYQRESEKAFYFLLKSQRKKSENHASIRQLLETQVNKIIKMKNCCIGTQTYKTYEIALHLPE